MSRVSTFTFYSTIEDKFGVPTVSNIKHIQDETSKKVKPPGYAFSFLIIYCMKLLLLPGHFNKDLARYFQLILLEMIKMYVI